MPTKTRGALLIALGIAIGVVLSIGQTSLAGGIADPTQAAAVKHGHGNPGASSAADNNSGQKADDRRLPLAELRTFVSILNRVKQGYVEKISDKELLDNAIRGMVAGLDPHSAYLDKAGFRELSISTSGKFGGLGLKVSRQNGFLRVISPIDDTPASKAGIRAGDMIVRIDGKPVKGMSLTQSVKAMRGPAGSDISLTLLRKGQDKPITLHLQRGDIKVASVKSHTLDDGYGYIRITQFTSQTGASVKQAVAALDKQAGGKLKGLVLDLRNNPGGVLSAAVDVADTFIDSGKIVSMRGRAPHTDQVFDATRGDRLDGAPMVVLVNQGSASAAEIVAGALQDDRRAVIMGRRTFGKGSVQTVIPLKSGAALKLTTARYYTPSGRSIQAEGIKPDVPIQSVKITPKKSPRRLGYSEADLSGALKNDTDTRATHAPGKADKARRAAEDKLAERDYGVYEALNLLKGLAILRQPGGAQAGHKPDHDKADGDHQRAAQADD